MNRRNEILVVVLVLQVVLMVLLTTLRAPAAAPSGKPLFDSVKTADVTQLTVTDNAGKSIELTKKGSDWVMSNADDFPADAVKITTFLDKLLKVQSGRLIARTDTSYARLQVADTNFVQRVSFQSGTGAAHNLLIGTSPTGSSAHVRADGQPEVYLTDSINSQDASTNATSWINTAYQTVAQDKVQRVALSNANGAFEFVKDANGVWTMSGLKAGQTFDPAKFTDLLPRVSTISLLQPLGKTSKPEYGLESPSAAITLTLQQDASSAKPVVVRLGVKDAAANTYTMSSSESPYIVLVGSFNYDDFVIRKLLDFLKPLPTPAAGVSGPFSATPTPAK